jgi:DNA invertase Pin-like site-specific DNA recombinase
MRLPHHPAGYARPAAPDDWQALAAAAERNGWPDLVVYDDSGRAGPQSPGLDSLEAAVRAGRHDVLLLPLPGRLGSGSGARLMRLLAACTRHGVPVHFVPTCPVEPAAQDRFS